MKEFAVAFMSFFDGELTIELIEAENKREAAIKHTKFMQDGFEDREIELPKEWEGLKELCHNCDAVIECIEIK